MILQPPKEPRSISWLLAAAWMALLYYTIPKTPDLRRLIVTDWGWGDMGFIHIVLAFGLACTLPALAFLHRHRARFPARRKAVVGLVFALFAGGVFFLLARRSPAEAMHFIQYGVLYGLVLRALLHRQRDPGVFPLAWLVCIVAGTLDEWIQWATPNRYFDFSDLVLNAVSALFGLCFFAGGLRPAYLEPRPRPRTLRLLCRVSLAQTALLAASYANTPALSQQVVRAFPSLSGASESWDEMAEYGHLYRDPRHGVFRSRLSPDALAAADRTRAEEAARLLPAADVLHLDAYRAFINERHTAGGDPFLHEARVHLYRRDKYMIHDYMPEHNRRRALATTAWCEQLILEARHPAAAAGFRKSLRGDEWAALGADAYGGAYESRPAGGDGIPTPVVSGGRTNLIVRVPAGARMEDLASAHAARRDKALADWRASRSGARHEKLLRAARIALCETRILELRFPETMARYPLKMTDYWRRALERDAGDVHAYESKVSQNLLTAMSRGEILLLLGGVALGLVAMDFRLSRRDLSPRNQETPP